MKQLKVGIINVTGYVGAELARLLHCHPGVKLSAVTGRSAIGQKLGEVFPHLSEIRLPVQDELGEVDIAFSAMPHKASIEVVPALIERGIRVVDLSADFRLKNVSQYPIWYEFSHPKPELLAEAVYGLPELYRSQIISASLIANPGCYPVSIILALAPVVKEGLIHPDIIVDSKSGISGAGRTLSLATHYAEASENVSAYALEGHRHLPEIVQELEKLNLGPPLAITFVPHLVPMVRGILSSCYALLREGKIPDNEKGKEEVRELYLEFYRDEPFVRIVANPPQTRHTLGNNFCLLYPTIDLKTGRLIVISCIDNLVKGAAGQAIQNMNLMAGFPETTGLEALALYP